MFLKTPDLDGLVTDIVKNDFRTAEVFRQFNISYCCGGNRSLPAACFINAVDEEELRHSLKKAMLSLHLPPTPRFETWRLHFFLDYIQNIYHDYFTRALPAIRSLIAEFIGSHAKTYPFFITVQQQLQQLSDRLYDRMLVETGFVFPQLKLLSGFDQLPADKWFGRNDLALSKYTTDTEAHTAITELLLSIRQQTTDYLPPAKACTNHLLLLYKLRELDEAVCQYMYLEQEFLLPRFSDLDKSFKNLNAITL